MMGARAFILGGMALGASLLLAAEPVRAEVYAFGIMGSGGANAEHATAPPGGYAASVGLGYAHHFPTFFLALEGTSDFNTAKFAINDADEFITFFQSPIRCFLSVDDSGSFRQAGMCRGVLGPPLEQEVLVQFGMNLRVGARFERTEVSFFLGPHWARVETAFQPYRHDLDECRETLQMLLLSFPLSPGASAGISCGRRPTDHVVRSASIWSGFRLGATASWPLSEQWALRTEYRYAQISGRHRGWFHTLHQHDALLGVQYAF